MSFGIKSAINYIILFMLLQLKRPKIMKKFKRCLRVYSVGQVQQVAAGAGVGA